MLLDCCLSVCPVCDVGVLWANGWMDQDETLGMVVGLGPGHNPIFWPMSVMSKRLDGLRSHLIWR